MLIVSKIKLHIRKANIFSLNKCINEAVHIANSGLYHIVLFKSDCTCDVNFKSYKVAENSLLFLSPSDVFYCEKQRQKILLFSWDKSVFAENHCETEKLINGLLFNNLFNSFFLKFSIKEIKMVCSKIEKIMIDIDRVDNDGAGDLFREVLQMGLNLKHELVVSKNQNSHYYQKAYQYFSLINRHFSMEHCVSVYAQTLGVQSKFLTKIFFDLKLENPKHFLNKRILLTAKKMLIHTSNTSTNISYDVGFNEPAYFSRFFKKNTGLTTKQFQKTRNGSIKSNIKKEKCPIN